MHSSGYGAAAMAMLGYSGWVSEWFLFLFLAAVVIVSVEAVCCFMMSLTCLLK